MTTPLETTQGPAWADPTSGADRASTQVISDQDAQNVLLQPFSTLDEPVLETIMRDVRAVGNKLKIVMKPLDKTVHPFGYMGIETSDDPQQQQQQPELGENQRAVIEELRDWDLWGPLVICLALSIVLSFKAPTNQASAVFAVVFMAIWFGSAVVTFNAQLLGGTISFFQSVCVLGYCVFPLVLSAIIVGMLRLTPMGWKWLDMIWIGIGFVWATRASSVFIGMYVKTSRRALAVYPVLFFYTFLSWLILLF
mmetsp:Transcript_13472/g.14755  ORF Transcript_13472/g.14755 Transcript_13472/m.14755 type:complete len:252 (-) Transcript_13472:477-1232(-)